MICCSPPGVRALWLLRCGLEAGLDTRLIGVLGLVAIEGICWEFSVCMRVCWDFGL